MRPASTLPFFFLPPEVIAYADIVLYNGKVLTVDDAFSVAEAVAIRDGKFLAAVQSLAQPLVSHVPGRVDGPADGHLLPRFQPAHVGFAQWRSQHNHPIRSPLAAGIAGNCPTPCRLLLLVCPEP